MKVAVIGGGISGVSAAKLLAEKNIEVNLFEKSNKLGGLIKCDRVDGNLFHRVGGHVFNSKNQDVLNWFWSHFDKENEFLKAKRIAKIFINGKVIGYPIENYIYELDEKEVESIVSDVLILSSKKYKDPLSFDSFNAYLKATFGNTLYDLYFKPYNTKIWNTNLDEIPMAWLEGKLPMPNHKQMLVSNILKKEESTMVHSTFFYPKMNGSQFVIDRLSEGLTVFTNTSVQCIEMRGKQLYVDGTPFDNVIYTGDIRNLYRIVDHKIISNQELVPVQEFASNGTSNMLCYVESLDYSWIYFPEKEYASHRIIFTGNLSPFNNENSLNKTCVVEYSGFLTETELRREIEKMPFKLKPIAYNYEPNSYVVQNRNTRDIVNSVKGTLLSAGIYLSGRFAEWEYYNMDKAIESSMEKVQNIMNSQI